EDNVFEEIEVDEGEVLVENKKTVLEENDVIVLDDSEEENEEIKVYTSQSTTSDQRRVLLFNVGELFEVSINEFDSEWWPLLQICDKHNHSSGRKEGIPVEKHRKTKVCPPISASQKSGERLKHSEAVQKLVEEEATKNYPPPAITSTVKDYATRILDLGSSVKELKRAE
ncbi:24732_t:CDS:2, partial [Racocetra persica]